MTVTVNGLQFHVEETGEGPVVLLLHDWGCLYGYQFAMRYPELVERIVGVDIGDAGSRAHLEELGWHGKLVIAAYQNWLALAWRIGGGVGDAMSRAMARLLRCPTDPKAIGAHMAYPYAVRWLGAAGGFQGLRVFKPEVPSIERYRAIEVLDADRHMV